MSASSCIRGGGHCCVATAAPGSRRLPRAEARATRSRGERHLRRRCSPRKASAQTTLQTASADDSSLLPWLARVCDDAALESKVALQDLGDGRGRGLRALRDLSPGEVIFSLPFRLVFAQQADDDAAAAAAVDDDDMPWSSLMAMRLLEERARGGELSPWIASLPAFVSTPPLEFTPEELAMAEDAAAEAEAAAVSRAHRRAAEALRGRLDAVGCTERDLRWATGVLHSRCFTYGPEGAHLAVPGVDMCNHSFETPSAAVKVVTSPENCQGMRATEEIAPAAAPGGGGGGGDVATDGGGAEDAAYFQLCAGEDGIEQDEEVTISYGPWPNDPFFLYFGFVPRGNPNDAVVLFDDVADVAACAERLGLLSPEEAAAAAATVAAAATSVAGGHVEERDSRRARMVITREGVDYSVVEAAAAAGLEGWEAVVEGRCRELLRRYSTTLKVDRAMLSGAAGEEVTAGGGGGFVANENETAALLYRMSKKEVLLGPLAAAAAAAAAAGAAEAAAAGAAAEA